jgi:arylsulfatase A-like enzyme
MIPHAMQWASDGPSPFFLMMITSVTHDPYQVPLHFGPPKDTARDNYIQTLQYTDHFLRELHDSMQKQGLLDNTVFCILGDHGESFRVLGRRSRWVPYEEVLRVPWIIWWPDRIRVGQRVDWPCSQLDVAPTLLTLIGYDVSEAGFDGRDAMVPLPVDRRLLFASWPADSPRGYLEGTRKYVYWPYNRKLFMHDLATDPGEETPVIVEGAEAAGVINDIKRWEQSTLVEIPARRFEHEFVFGHWRVFASGRSAWAYYVP